MPDEPFIWLQPYEQEGDADCGCRLLRNDETESPSFTLCALHAAAPDLMTALIRIRDHESRADRRHRNMVDLSELRDLQRIARLALSAIFTPSPNAKRR